MQSVLLCVEHFSLAYIDNIVIYSSSFHEHLAHISTVLDRLSKAYLTVKMSKCSWCYYTFDFLGFCIGNGKISIPSARVAPFSSLSRPITKSQLRSFLGLCNFYSRFISNFSQIVSPLNSLLRRTSPDTLPWSDDLDSTFHSIITSIVNHSALIIPLCNEVRCVFSDASMCGIGGVLCVSRSDSWMPLLSRNYQLNLLSNVSICKRGTVWPQALLEGLLISCVSCRLWWQQPLAVSA